MEALSQKQTEFVAAMGRYEGGHGYARLGHGVAAGNLLMQAALLALGFQANLSWWALLGLFVAAVFVADFVNGFVHLLMDHSDQYTSALGPIIANFHLHHVRPRYQRRPLLAVYYFESGSKIWLFIVQALALMLALVGVLPETATLFVAYFAVLSSFAEVSHYTCHALTGPWVSRLGRWRVILAKKHHRWHHARDNVNYAFLNGVSDPVLNAIARRFFGGYKTRSDLHAVAYGAKALRTLAR